MGIDISNVKIMGQFREAIEKYVEDYVADMLRGTHGSNRVVLTGGSKTNTETNISIDLSQCPADKHWGIITIANTEIRRGAPQVQMTVWWDKQNTFHYSIANNSMAQGTDGAYYTPVMNLQYIVDDSVTFTSDNHLKFKIKDCYWAHYSSEVRQPTLGGTIKIDYHIW